MHHMVQPSALQSLNWSTFRPVFSQVARFFGLADIHLHIHQVNVAVSWRDAGAMQCLLTCQSSLPQRQTGQRSVRERVPLKSLIQRVQLLASWCGQKAGSRALFNSRCFTLRPLPSFPGRRAPRSIRQVTGTKKRRVRQREKKSGRESEREKLAELGAPTNHFVTSKLWQAPGARERTRRKAEKRS